MVLSTGMSHVRTGRKCAQQNPSKWNRRILLETQKGAMAVDNPSYFSLAGGGTSSGVVTPLPGSSATGSTSAVNNTTSGSVSSHSRGLAFFFRRRPDRMGVASSGSTVSTSTTSTLMHHESNRSSASGASAPSTPTEDCALMLPHNVNGNHGNHGSGCQRRSFRNLFRSVSANSESERTQQILNGDPRPSDVAPPSPYLPHRSHSHSENDRRRPGRRKVLKSASELLSNDMVYCGLPGEDPGATADDDSESNEPNEVFLGVDDARYYNLSATLPSGATPGSAAAGRRRHSIGTFLGKDRSLTRSQGASADKKHNQKQPLVLRQPTAMAPPVPTEIAIKDDKANRNSGRSTRRRRHRSASSKGTRGGSSGVDVTAAAEDDVILVSSKDSEASILWVDYLTACFEQISRQQGRPPFRVRAVTVEDALPQCGEEKIGSARLQIVIVCPVFLERILARSGQAAILSRQFTPDKVLAMMLGVHDGHLTAAHKAALVSYPQWKKYFVKDQDETLVGNFLGAAVAILGTTSSVAPKSDKTAFSVLPKKVKMGQNRVIALLNDPLLPEDNVAVIVDRCGEAIDVNHVRRRNPYTLQFSIPERCLDVSMLVGVRISKNGTPLGVRQVKCESRLRELDQILRAHDNPLEFMCQTFGFNPGDREQLDNWMVHAFQRNIPPHFNLLSTPAGMVPAHRNHSSPEENPTLLHFAARFGLEKLAWQLLECPGGDLACDLRNVSELTPADLAEQAGHTKLAHQLRGYMQMNEFTNMYSYLKVMSESTSGPPVPSGYDCTTTLNSQEYDEEYCCPRPLSEAYCVPPAARPITLAPSSASSTPIPVQLPPPNPMESNYSRVPTPTPLILMSASSSAYSNDSNNANDSPTADTRLGRYMEMHPAGLKPSGSAASSRLGTPTLGSRLDSVVERAREENSPTPGLSSKATNFTKSRDQSGPQDELLEIINDFKNNVFTITEVERLVENWRNRNDVQQNFKDKQRQLMAMREEYDRIQKHMKDEMKMPTPFDRIRKFFTKGKKDLKESANTNEGSSSSPSLSASANKTEGSNGNVLSNHRPVSSLSLHSVSSSSSSGRMSTVSGCSGTSLGDSGTHSDPEDRKNTLQNQREGKSHIMSYEIPPAPKPFTGTYSPVRHMTSPTESSTNKIRPPQPIPRPDDSAYYIAFRPSGLPVHLYKADGTMREPQTPNSPSEEPEYLDLTSNTKDGPDAESNEKNNSYVNLDPTTGKPSISELVPVTTAPPGMCIPTNYMNITPIQSTDNHPKNCSDTNFNQQESKTSDKNNFKDTIQSSEEYVQFDAIKDTTTELADIQQFPEYVNVAASRQDDELFIKKQRKMLPPLPIPLRGDGFSVPVSSLEASGNDEPVQDVKN
ncbi:uncharacterized protein LOC107265423 isoform X2 [Cephus cinctus]|uniref:Uncharacterized protein LOC107265423 isoform X2 n=1 Tax=Cephus cinctus TaxID=211228 RepID=A0AAJ7BNE6_CEPCN|nr:uncharacterized protein LOC107265423 isoform X2 [Cephus cinctus]